jgi:hypothetical protein
MYPSPERVQEVWSNITRRRYKQTWQGEALEPVGHTLEWQPCEIACCHCGHPLGSYVAYRVVYPQESDLRGECGIVENTSRHYERHAGNAVRQAGSRGPKSSPRFWFEGELTRRAAKTSACFRCPGCDREYRRNLARLGAKLFTLNSEAAFILE